MKNNYQIKILYMVIAVFILNSCRSTKDIAMFQDLESRNYLQNSINKPAAHKIKPFDNLYISILTLDEEVNRIFNPSMGGDGYSSGTHQMYGTPTSQYLNGYEVKANGMIELPILGEIQFAGLTLAESEERLKKKAEEFLTAPTVKVKLLNFRINVLGEVNQPGFFYNYEGDINIIEAISLANGITAYADLKNVIVNRQTATSTNSFKLDITNSNIYKSEVYYLQPNDLVYIPPTELKRRSENERSYTLFLSTISTILVVFTFFN